MVVVAAVSVASSIATATAATWEAWETREAAFSITASTKDWDVLNDGSVLGDDDVGAIESNIVAADRNCACAIIEDVVKITLLHLGSALLQEIDTMSCDSWASHRRLEESDGVNWTMNDENHSTHELVGLIIMICWSNSVGIEYASVRVSVLPVSVCPKTVYSAFIISFALETGTDSFNQSPATEAVV